LNILQIIFSLITLAIAGYGIITGNFEFQAYMILFLSLTMLVVGIKEIKKNNKAMGWLVIGVFAFLTFVYILRYMFR